MGSPYGVMVKVLYDIIVSNYSCAIAFTFRLIHLERHEPPYSLSYGLNSFCSSTRMALALNKQWNSICH